MMDPSLTLASNWVGSPEGGGRRGKGKRGRQRETGKRETGGGKGKVKLAKEGQRTCREAHISACMQDCKFVYCMLNVSAHGSMISHLLVRIESYQGTHLRPDLAVLCPRHSNSWSHGNTSTTGGCATTANSKRILHDTKSQSAASMP